MRSLTRLENEQNYCAICTTYFYLLSWDYGSNLTKQIVLATTDVFAGNHLAASDKTVSRNIAVFSIERQECHDQ
jgi:hypothetical protein